MRIPAWVLPRMILLVATARYAVQSYIACPTRTGWLRVAQTQSSIGKTYIHRSLVNTVSFLSSSSTTSSVETPESTANECQWTTDAVRSTFIDYFATPPRSHTVQPSSPSVPLNDPTLLFTNAGMNQFKPIFLGQVDPNSPLATLKSACNSQKCIRAGGKHNDLEDVGRDTYHHTFFEMLGSWSFGDYFKKEAIDYAWDLLTNVYKLDPNRLYATYFAGNDQVPCDEEAREYWLQYLPEERIIGCDARDNFWEMGEVGPCGPCSEIHYDRIGGRDAAHLVNADDPDVIEIWNIVFIQFNRESETKLQTLPAKHIDTGMGLERLVSILQNKSSNYDIDCFQPIFAKLATLTNKGPYTGRVGAADTDLKDTAYRAIADHARTLSFAIADGAVPNNEGRGYVLRRILRRATRYGQQILNCESGFFAKLVPVVVETFGKNYPELAQQRDTIIRIIEEEEQSFSAMLERGIKYFAEVKSELENAGETVVPGSKAFFLYDTLGFPIDLTELMAQESSMTVDTSGFAQEMEAQKERSRRAQRKSRWEGGTELELQAEETAWLSKSQVNPTNDAFKYDWDTIVPAKIMAIYTEEGYLGKDDTIQPGQYVGLILDQSSFYAEAGGQDSDTGTIELVSDTKQESRGVFNVMDVQVYGGYILHKGVLEEGLYRVGSTVRCRVDYDRRRRVAPNHSMTHVLNSALRQVLGPDVDQRGSLCNEEKLRFDFSHKQAMSVSELEQVEALCQSAITMQHRVTSGVMPLEEAKAIDGVRAVFGEVYPDPVRVVRIGNETSIEFCGGTHVENLSEAEAFVVLEETAVAKGIRRITAVTRDLAKQAQVVGAALAERATALEASVINDPSDDLYGLAGTLRKDVDAALVSATLKITLRQRIETVQKKILDQKKRLMQKRVDMAMQQVEEAVDQVLKSGKQLLVMNVDIAGDAKSCQRIINGIQKRAPKIAFLGLSEEQPGSGGKLLAFAQVPEHLTESGLNADEWVRASLECCGGRGGGKATNAQGQSATCNDLGAVLKAANDFANLKIGSSV